MQKTREQMRADYVTTMLKGLAGGALLSAVVWSGIWMGYRHSVQKSTVSHAAPNRSPASLRINAPDIRCSCQPQ
jgi:hypothetical protein